MKLRRLFLLAVGGLFLALPGRLPAQTWTATNIFNNWTSLAMTADGGKIAADSFLGGIYTSTDGGTNWLEVAAPDPLHWSVLAAATNGGNLVAAFYGGGLYTSADWGLHWLSSAAQTDDWNCLAASWDGTQLVAGTSPGELYTSHDSGATFTSRLPQNKFYQAIAASADGGNLVAVVQGGNIYRSTDAGETWAATPAPSAYWSGIAASSNGVFLAAAVQGGGIYTSTDAGTTWTLTRAPSTNWDAIASSADGSQLVAVVDSAGGLIYSSTNSGASWTPNAVLTPTEYGSAVTASADGTRRVAAANGGTGSGGGLIYLYTGTGWVASTAPRTNWTALAASTDGSMFAAAVSGGVIYTFTDFGDHWTAQGGSISSSPGPEYLYTTNITAITNSITKTKSSTTNIFTNTVITWTTNLVASPSQYWSAIASSADGSRLVAAGANGGIFTASNSGSLWVSNGVPWQIADGEIPTTTNSLWETQGWVWTSNNVPNQDWSAVYSSPDGNTLVALARAGWSYKSTNGGVTWAALSTPYDFWQSVAASASGSNLLAASQNGYVYQSANAGVSWSELALVPGGTNVISSDAFNFSVIYTNLNRQGTDTNLFITNAFGPLVAIPSLAISNNLAVSSQGLFITNAVGFSLNSILTNISDTGTNFSTNVISALLGVNLQGSNVFALSPVSADALGSGTLGKVVLLPGVSFTNVATDQVAIPDATGRFNSNGVVNVSLTNVFSSALLITNVQNITVSNVLNIRVAIANVRQTWSAVASSADGSHLAAAVNGGPIFVSTNSGVTWQASGAPSANWNTLVMSSDGRQLTATVNGGGLYSSPDSGVTWEAETNLPEANWSAVATSADGAQVVAVVRGGVIYTAQNPLPGPQTLPSPTPLPALHIQLTPEGVVLAWPASVTNAVLQQNLTLSGTHWTDSPVTPIVTNGQYQMTLPVTNNQSLYRLRSQ